MRTNARHSIVTVPAVILVIAGALAYLAGYATPVTVFAENTAPVYPQPAVNDAIHIVDVYSADPHGEARRVTSTGGTHIPAGWASDGSLLYVSDRIGRPALFAQHPDDDAARLITDYAGMTGAAHPTPDRSAVLFLVGPSLLSTEQRVMRVSVAGGQPEPVASGHFIDGGARCALAPAMLCAIAERHNDGEHVIFSALNPATGRSRELARVDGDDFVDLRWALSPDGTRIAVADANGFKVRVVMIGGPAAESISVSGTHALGPVSFTRDSRGVIVPSINGSDTSLIAISLQGAAQILWHQPGAADISGIPSPDGRHVAVWVRARNASPGLSESR